MKPTVAVLYGDAGSASLIHALKAWRNEHAPGAAYDAMFAEYIVNAKVTTTLYPAGRATVQVEVAGRRRSTDDVYYYEASVSGGELRLETITD